MPNSGPVWEQREPAMSRVSVPPRLPRPPFRNTGLPQGSRVPWPPGIPTSAHHRRMSWGGRGSHRWEALTCSRSGLPAPTGDEVPEQAIRWVAARSSFQELRSEPGSAPPQPPIQGLHPREGKWGGELGPGSGTRAAPPRAVSSPCRAPPGAARLACGGRDSQVEARRPARPAAARACPVPRPPQGPRDNEGRAA